MSTYPLVLLVIATLGTALAAAEPAAPSSPLSADDIARHATTADGHRVEAISGGARIWCRMQDLDGLLTPTGLELRSVDDGEPGALQVRTRALGRAGRMSPLAPGWVAVDGSVARLLRPGLIEEITTSSEGVRQDWVVTERIPGAGHLALAVALDQAEITAVADQQVALTVAGGRHLVWRGLAVSDADGRTVAARFANADGGLRILVDDATATYPIRIDPTFTDADWVSMGGLPGADGGVNAIAASGSDLYIGGSFTVVGTIMANRIAKWNGTAWSSLGSGMNNTVNALAVSGSDVYAGGAFTTAGVIASNHIARWDGSAWSAMGLGVNGQVHALAVAPPGSRWGGSILVGGSFSTMAGMDPMNNIAVCSSNGLNWSPLDTGTNGTVHALSMTGDVLYVGGQFTTAGSVVVNSIARWSFNSFRWSWSALGAGIDRGFVAALAVSGSDVYAGGDFIITTGGGVVANSIARWNGSAWSRPSSGINGSVYDLAVSGGDVYAGGSFTMIGGVAANRVARWNGSAWSALGSGMNNTVSALAVSGGNVYAGGSFTSAGVVAANCITSWNGATWSALGAGTNGVVRALAMSGSDLYMGGDFITAGGVVAHRVARWNGNAWSALGSGIDNSVFALAVSGSDVYAGGNFTNAGGAPANRVARWDGGAWWALGSGMNGTVSALAVSGRDVYAGGDFTNAGGVSTNHIACWNGSAWLPLGLGVNDTLYALATFGGHVYAGGRFTNAGAVSANRIACWNGSAWSALGPGINDDVYALAVSGGHVYAGGSFHTAGGVDANRIAHWNGSAWSALGAGMNKSVLALAASDEDVYVSGTFSVAGGKVSAYTARLVIPKSIAYDPNGGTGSIASTNKHWQVSLTLSTGAGFTRTDYAFAGWNTAANGSGTAYAGGGTYNTEAAVTLFAQWTPFTYAVTYDANGGTGTIPAAAKTHGVPLTLSPGSDFTRTGHSFTGWNTAANGSGTAFAGGATYSADAAAMLFAQWTPHSYAVTYDANGGTGSIGTATKTHGVALALSDGSGFTRTGHSFAGWNTAAGGSGTTYAGSATYSAEAAVTLYAQWTLLTYAVTYDANGGTGSIAAATKTHGVPLTLSTGAGLTRTGHSFAGWNTAADGSGTTYASGATYSAEAAATIYAQWTSTGGGPSAPAVSSGGGGGCGLGSAVAFFLAAFLAAWRRFR